jgi:hypothetical protein
MPQTRTMATMVRTSDVIYEDAGMSLSGKELKRVTVSTRAFPYRIETEHPYEPDRVIAEDHVAHVGDVIDVLPMEFVRGIRLNAFLRGNQNIAILTGSEVPIETGTELQFSAADATDTELINWIKDKGPRVQEVIDASEGDAETAARLLAAEAAATGNDPRKGVVMGLEAIVRRTQPTE